MTHFGPTRAELKFRLFVSLLGLAMIIFALLLRGMPVEIGHVLLLFTASVFLGSSAGFSLMGLSRPMED